MLYECMMHGHYNNGAGNGQVAGTDNVVKKGKLMGCKMVLQRLTKTGLGKLVYC